MQTPIVYRDGLLIVAAGEKYHDIRYAISRADSSDLPTMVLSQEDARELAAALTWVISEVDARNGRESFRPPHSRKIG